MIRVKRITGLDKFAETIAKPKGAIPKFGLPKWKMMSIEHKIPMIPAPKDAYNFTRCKVGKKLWVTEPRKEFDLSDPYCYEINFPYEPLHDKHLFEFFSKPANIKSLLRAGLITDDMDAKCSLRDYNTYRGYLNKIHADRMRRELKRKNRLSIEKRELRYAEDQAQKKVKRLKKEEKLVSARKYIIQQQLLQQKSKIRKQREKEHKNAQRLKLLKLVKQEEQKLVNAKRKERTEQIRKKLKIEAEIARYKIIDMPKHWKKIDKVKIKVKNKQLMDIEQQRQKAIEKRWRKKQDFQKKDLEKEKILLQRINERRKQFIENYNNKINRETARMRRLLDDAKLYTNCYIKRHLPDGRVRVCCEKYFQKYMNEKGEK